jgi:hypothetical protein
MDRIRRGEGLDLLWKYPFECNLINYSANFINVEANHPTLPQWRFTGFYGYLDSERRRDSSNLLRTLSQDNSLPWCTIGDYNDLLSTDVDIQLTGYPYTWIRGRGSADVK